MVEKLIRGKSAYLLIVVFAVFLYSYRLDKSPVHLNQDELMFSLNAYSVSTTLHDYYGNYLPFYFWHLGGFWATPVIVYLTSLFLKFAPLSETTIRLPSVFIGISTVVLVMVLSLQIWRKKILSLIAGLLTATTPVLFMHSRLLLDNLYPVPFVLLWLIFLKFYIDEQNLPLHGNKSTLAIFLSGLSLGVGIHSYHAAKIMMPVYFLASIPVVWMDFRKKPYHFAVFVLGFLLPIIAFLPWLSLHPDTILNQVSYLGSIDKSIEVQKGFLGIVNLARLELITSSYIKYLDPKILFISGDRSLIHSTQATGAFLFPLVFLLVFGILSVLFKEKDNISRLILFGFLTYPIAPSLINDPSRISRGLVVIPFLILLSIYGFKYLSSFNENIFKALVISLFVISFIQFSSFLNYYFGDYRVQSYGWFNNDIGGALESSLRSSKIRNVQKIYLDEFIPFVDLYFRFYQIKLGIDAQGTWKFYDFRSEDFTRFPAGSLAVVRYDHILSKEYKLGNFERIETIREPGGNETFYLYYRE